MAINSTEKPLSVLVVEDDECTRDALCDGIAAQHGMAVVASFGLKRPAIAWLKDYEVDVLLIDLGLPDGSGLDVITACSACRPHCDILVITLFGDEANVLAAIDAGAVGYILKDTDDLNVVQFIRDLRLGGSPMSPLVARKLLGRTRPKIIHVASLEVPASTNANGLTVRELRALDLIARGYSYNEIASLLSISLSTVQTHIKRVYSKLSVHSRGEAVFEANKLGLLRSGLVASDQK